MNSSLAHRPEANYFRPISTVVEIEEAIQKLPREGLGELREWFDEDTASVAGSEHLGALYDGEEGPGDQLVDGEA